MFDFVRLAEPSLSMSSGRPWRTVRAVLDIREDSGAESERDGAARTPFLSNSNCNGVIDARHQ
jgi:hypothetical protein